MKAGVGDPYLVQFATFGNTAAPHDTGFDAAAEFLPHHVADNLEALGRHAIRDVRNMTNIIYDYDDLVEGQLSLDLPEWPRYQCVLPNWDNTPRKPQGQANLFLGSTPREVRVVAGADDRQGARRPSRVRVDQRLERVGRGRLPRAGPPPRARLPGGDGAGRPTCDRDAGRPDGHPPWPQGTRRHDGGGTKPSSHSSTRTSRSPAPARSADLLRAGAGARGRARRVADRCQRQRRRPPRSQAELAAMERRLVVRATNALGRNPLTGQSRAHARHPAQRLEGPVTEFVSPAVGRRAERRGVGRPARSEPHRAGDRRRPLPGASPTSETQANFVGVSQRGAIVEAMRFVRYALDALAATGGPPPRRVLRDRLRLRMGPDHAHAAAGLPARARRRGRPDRRHGAACHSSGSTAQPVALRDDRQLAAARPSATSRSTSSSPTRCSPTSPSVWRRRGSPSSGACCDRVASSSPRRSPVRSSPTASASARTRPSRNPDSIRDELPRAVVHRCRTRRTGGSTPASSCTRRTAAVSTWPSRCTATSLFSGDYVAESVGAPADAGALRGQAEPPAAGRVRAAEADAAPRRRRSRRGGATTTRIAALEAEVAALRTSESFRIGQMALAPVRLARRVRARLDRS